ncbi:MAG: AraC family transcriptional regulator [Spirochaetaceae bacterium]
MDKITLDDCPIANIRLEMGLNRYNISARVGKYYEFDYSKISNEHHRHDCYELVIVLNGRGTFCYKENNYILKEGALFISEPDSEHEIHISKNENMTLLYFFVYIQKKQNKSSFTYKEKIIDQFLAGHKNVVENQNKIFGYINFFEEFINNNGSRNDHWFIKAVENLLFHCLELFCNEKPHQHGIDNPTADLFEKALDYIDQNLSVKISAQNISDNINTSKRNLYRIFNKNMDRSVNDYVNEKKISLAESYLKMNMSVTESASLVGFENLSQFNKLFRKYKNISPREFKSNSSTDSSGYGRRRKTLI